MITARVSSDSSDTSTILSGPASILVMEAESGAILADRWIEVAIDEDGVFKVFAGESGEEFPSEVYDSSKALA